MRAMPTLEMGSGFGLAIPSVWFVTVVISKTVHVRAIPVIADAGLGQQRRTEAVMKFAIAVMV